MQRILAALAATLLMFTVWLPAQAQTFPSDIVAVRFDWSSNQNKIAVSDDSDRVTILDAQTQTILNTLPTIPFPVRALRWSDDGTRLAVGGEYTIQIWDSPWDVAQAVLSLTLQVPANPLGLGMLDSIDWNGATQQILTIALGRVYIWDSGTGELVETIEPFTTPMVSAAWSPDGMQIAHADSTGFVSIESLTTNEAGGADTYDRDAVLTMSWEPRGDNLVVGTNSGTLQAFGFFPRRLGSDVVSLREDNVAIFSVAWHPTLQWVAVGYADGLIEIWNPYTYELIQRAQEPTGLPVMSVSWSPDGTQLAYADGLNFVIAPAPIWEEPTPTSTSTYTPEPTATPTPTETPLPTPTPTLTPSPYPTPAATATPAPFQRLRLTSLCSSQPGEYRLWRVRNSNPVDVVFTWDIYGSPTSQNGFGVVPPAVNGVQGEVIFSSVTEAGPNTLRLFVNGAQQDVKASGGATCPTPTPVP